MSGGKRRHARSANTRSMRGNGRRKKSRSEERRAGRIERGSKSERRKAQHHNRLEVTSNLHRPPHGGWPAHLTLLYLHLYPLLHLHLRLPHLRLHQPPPLPHRLWWSIHRPKDDEQARAVRVERRRDSGRSRAATPKDFAPNGSPSALPPRLHPPKQEGRVSLLCPATSPRAAPPPLPAPRPQHPLLPDVLLITACNIDLIGLMSTAHRRDSAYSCTVKISIYYITNMTLIFMTIYD